MQPNKSLQLAVRHKVPLLGVVPATEFGCYVLRSISVIFLLALLVAQIASADESVLGSMHFNLFQNAETIASEVAARQAELESSKLRFSLQIQFGTEVEWHNGCAWLESQTENTGRMYLPVQPSIPEIKYYCLYWLERPTLSVQDVAEAQALVTDFVTNFGGSPANWLVIFED